jgi:S-adenosylmethionine:tRNA ribosyltransferase-isomerase
MTAVGAAASVPPALEADRRPEARGLARDEVRLLVSSRGADVDASFLELPELLEPGDLLVVNESKTLAASLPARGPFGPFLLNLSTDYGERVWLAEPRWSPSRPGPLPLPDGSVVDVAGVRATVVARYPGIARLAFFRFDGDIRSAMERSGRPIRYGYLAEEPPIDAYQTAFARVPGSVEMPSAGRPFSERVLRRLRRRGVAIARIVLHAGVSSLEVGDDVTGAPPVLPEPYSVPAGTVEAIAESRRDGGRVIAVGTTVVRALESAAAGGCLHPARGFTRKYLAPPYRARVADGLLTGFHAERTTHLDLLASVAGTGRLGRAYDRARRRGYLFHEFGDVHLILPEDRPALPAGSDARTDRYFPERPARARSAW